MSDSCFVKHKLLSSGSGSTSSFQRAVNVFWLSSESTPDSIRQNPHKKWLTDTFCIYSLIQYALNLGFKSDYIHLPSAHYSWAVLWPLQLSAGGGWMWVAFLTFTFISSSTELAIGLILDCESQPPWRSEKEKNLNSMNLRVWRSSYDGSLVETSLICLSFARFADGPLAIVLGLSSWPRRVWDRTLLTPRLSLVRFPVKAASWTCFMFSWTSALAHFSRSAWPWQRKWKGTE